MTSGSNFPGLVWDLAISYRELPKFHPQITDIQKHVNSGKMGTEKKMFKKQIGLGKQNMRKFW